MRRDRRPRRRTGIRAEANPAACIPWTHFVTSATDERITDHKQVANLLRRIMDHHSLLTVTLADSAEAYNSAILDLDDHHRFLTLDELKPLSGHERLLQQAHLRVRTAVHGVEVRFGTSLRHAVKESGIWMYRVELPREVLYRQRRSSYRIRIGMGSGVTVELQKNGRELVEARVLDMSETGLGIQTDSGIRLNLGDRLPCTLGLPDGRPIHCELEIRYLREALQARDMLHFGGHFLDMQPVERTTLARVITDLQRDMIRRLPKD
jgi:c-di-GMP-binding flagellar brake protein YcgR